MGRLKIYFVCKADLGRKLNIDSIARKGLNTEMKYKSNHVIMRCKRNKATVIFYQAGKMVCFGGKTREEAKKITRQFARKAQKLGNPFIAFKYFQIQSIVCVYKLNRKIINLEKIAIQNPKIKYEPELQPFASFKF